jgi:very-short-patch-repair endonuclease
VAGEQDTKLTLPHQKVQRYMLLRGIRVRTEDEWPPCTVDCYLPYYHTAVEIDGPKHSAKRDAKRDQRLYELYMLKVYRIKAKDADHPEKWWTNLATFLNNARATAESRKSYGEEVLSW